MSKIIMPQDWIEAIGKAASALRFRANNSEWLTEAAKKELISIAETLTEIECNTVIPDWDEATIQEYNEYLDWLEEASGEQEVPEDF